MLSQNPNIGILLSVRLIAASFCANSPAAQHVTKSGRSHDDTHLCVGSVEVVHPGWLPTPMSYSLHICWGVYAIQATGKDIAQSITSIIMQSKRHADPRQRTAGCCLQNPSINLVLEDSARMANCAFGWLRLAASFRRQISPSCPVSVTAASNVYGCYHKSHSRQPWHC